MEPTLSSDARTDRGRRPTRWRWLVLVGGGLWFALVFDRALSATRRELVGIDDASDELAHLLAFAGVAAVLFAAFGPGRRRWTVAIGVIAACGLLGLAIELGQLSSPGRTFEVSDLVFDLLGGWLGLATAAVVAWALGWNVLTAATLAALGVSLVALPFLRPADASDLASGGTRLDCPERPFEPAQPSDGPEDEPVLEYRLTGGSGTSITAATAGPALAIGNPSAVQWSDSGLVIDGAADIESDEPPLELIEKVRAAGEVSVEAWFEPRALPQHGPARVVTISDGTQPGESDLHLGVDGRGVSFRVRTDCDLFNWRTAEDVLDARHLTHVVATYRPGEIAIYVDGRAVTTTRVRVGALDDWEAFRLHVGDEAGGGRRFEGAIASLALFDRALTADAVALRFAGGDHASVRSSRFSPS